jgi:hypothetical protein
MTWILVAGLAALLVVVVGVLCIGGARRNRRLAAWARSIPISPAQAESMHALWAAGQAKRPPTVDPLAALSEEDVAYVLKICGASFRPREFGDASVVRVASFMHFTRLGFSDRQAAVLVGMMVNMVGKRTRMADIYRGSTLSKLLGLVSVLLLVWSVSSLLSGDWVGAFYTIVGSTLAAYGGYRVAGGRHNPELAKAAWERQHHIDVVSDQVASWPAKVEAMFDMLEQESGGDYAAALASLKLGSVPQAVRGAFAEALRSPSRDAWNRLKRAFLENPPGR